MAMGKPIVATRVGGIPEVVQEGQTGYLVNPEDPGAIAEKVIFLLRDREMRQKMGRQGRHFVETYYDNRLMVSRLEELYENLMENRER